jgi:hypothetical protein
MTPPSRDGHCDWPEFVSDGERAAVLAVRLVELAPEDTAAVAAAVAWLTRTGQPLEAIAYAEMAYRMTAARQCRRDPWCL